MRDIPIEKSLWGFEGYVKVGHVAVYQKNHLLDLEGDWN